jgi:hypothetical protein
MPKEHDDKRARDILFRKFWSKDGWVNREIPLEDFEYAKQAGVMFDLVPFRHDDVVTGVIQLRSRIDKKRVAGAFLASLTSRRLEWRSALGSYAAQLNLVEHRFIHVGAGISCDSCSGRADDLVDPNVLSFERLKWGGVRHVDPYYAYFDLKWFDSFASPSPSADDVSTFRHVLQRVRALDPEARISNIEPSLRGLFPSNTAERRQLIEVLGLAGILIPAGRPNYFSSRPLLSEHEHAGSKNDWGFPTLWWRGTDGVNQVAVDFWFSEFGL